MVECHVPRGCADKPGLKCIGRPRRYFYDRISHGKGSNNSGSNNRGSNSRGFNNSGFTLIEVIVAMGIIAVCMAAVMMTVTTTARNAAGLKERTFAHWVAMNKMAELHINTKEWPAPRKTTGTELMAEHEWHWTMEVEETEDDTVRRVYIRVRANEDDEFSLTTLVGFVGKPSS